MKKIFIMLILVLLLIGCSADVTVNTVKSSGAPLASATVTIIDGSETVAITATGVDGSRVISLEFGDYTITGEKSGYMTAQGTLHVDLVGSLVGISIDIPLVAEEVAEE